MMDDFDFGDHDLVDPRPAALAAWLTGSSQPLFAPAGTEELVDWLVRMDADGLTLGDVAMAVHRHHGDGRDLAAERRQFADPLLKFRARSLRADPARISGRTAPAANDEDRQ